MKEIELTHGKLALIDDSDLELVSQYKWFAWTPNKGKIFYAVTNIGHGRGNRTILYMHRLIMPSVSLIDHEDHDGLNNQRYNIRIADKSTNGQNQRKTELPRSSKYKGVSFMKSKGKWEAYISLGKSKKKHLGLYETEEEAAKVYNEAAFVQYGVFAKSNSIEEQ